MCLNRGKHLRDTRINHPITGIARYLLFNVSKDEIIIKFTILKYSPRNKEVNLSLPASLLTPETDSLSPSMKSKGERCLSPKISISHTNPNTGLKKIDQFSPPPHIIKYAYDPLQDFQLKVVTTKIKARPNS